MSDEMKAHPVIPADMTKSHNSPSPPELSLKILSPRFKFPEPAIPKGLSCFICFREISLSRNLLSCDRCSHQYKTRVTFYYRFTLWSFFAVVVQLLSHVQLCDPMDCSMPGLPVHTNSWSLLKLMSIESVMPSNHYPSPVSSIPGTPSSPECLEVFVICLIASLSFPVVA